MLAIVNDASVCFFLHDRLYFLAQSFWQRFLLYIQTDEDKDGQEEVVDEDEEQDNETSDESDEEFSWGKTKQKKAKIKM